LLFWLYLKELLNAGLFTNRLYSIDCLKLSSILSKQILPKSDNLFSLDNKVKTKSFLKTFSRLFGHYFKPNSLPIISLLLTLFNNNNIFLRIFKLFF